MDIDRHVELRGRREQAVIARMIEEAALGRAVDHRAHEAQVLHGARELGRGSVGTLQRQRGEAREAIGMPRNGMGEVIVHLVGQGDAVGPGHEIRAGTAVREHLYRNACLVHGLQATFADFGQELERVRTVTGRRSRPISAAADCPLVEARSKSAALDLKTRPRRNRRTEWLRRLVREHALTADDLIWPLFLVEGSGQRVPVESMPGIERLTVDQAVREAERAADLKIPAIALFPYTDPA